ncbi:hypothetical protein IQ247_09670 [Plectonema cf. radiosum LEGE 06105]|uniref:Nitrate reductase n=1 Tax=Plectonema cf. radiosum LEGE 06105 TaxID=945769 RepID=A0A8J7FER6_9CYAN|nr:hypothetical protein [Plectonema radiosum]MBE9212951.1 hypothetical protein [Plectonema cf. radiosum LEGE 06105]
MSFSFGKQSQKASYQNIKQIKQWIYQALQIDDEISISLSQLQCTEPGCPPIETVINIMTNPVQQYKIHKSIAEIEYTDISRLNQDK